MTKTGVQNRDSGDSQDRTDTKTGYFMSKTRYLLLLYRGKSAKPGVKKCPKSDKFPKSVEMSDFSIFRKVVHWFGRVFAKNDFLTFYREGPGLLVIHVRNF